MKKPSGTWLLSTVITLCVLVFVALPIFLPMYCDHHANQEGAGQQRDMQWVGWAFLSVEEVVHSESANGHRLSLVDPLGGRLLLRRVLDVESYGPECRRAPPERLWCRWDQELRLLSAQSLQDIARWADLARLHPSLAGGLSSFEPRVEPGTGRLLVGTNDGLKVALDPSRLQADQVSEEAGFAALSHRPDATSYYLELDGRRFSIDGDSSTDRQVLVRRDPDSGQEVKLAFRAESGPGEPAASTYLKATFITPTDTRTGGPGRLEGPPGLLLGHQTSLDDKQARRLVTRVDLEGRPLWTAELPLGRIAAAFLGADRLALSLRGEVEQTVALELASGRLLWTYTH